MTVEKLIALLQEFPPDLTVYLSDWNEGYRCPGPDVSPSLLAAGRKVSGCGGKEAVQGPAVILGDHVTETQT